MAGTDQATKTTGERREVPLCLSMQLRIQLWRYKVMLGRRDIFKMHTRFPRIHQHRWQAHALCCTVTVDHSIRATFLSSLLSDSERALRLLP